MVDKILNKDPKLAIDESDMILVVQEYIRRVKGVNVNISLGKGMKHTWQYADNVGKLVSCFEYARHKMLEL